MNYFAKTWSKSDPADRVPLFLLCLLVRATGSTGQDTSYVDMREPAGR